MTIPCTGHGSVGRARVIMQDGDPLVTAELGERAQAGERVVRVASQELGSLDRPARAPVLVTPVRAEDGHRREVEVEVRCSPSRAGGARQHEPRDLACVRVECGCGVAIGEKLAQGSVGKPRPRPLPRLHRRRWARLPRRLEGAAESELDLAQPMRAGLHTRHQAVERRDVASGRVAAVHVRLDEGRARPAERVVDRLPRPEEPSQEHLDELGDELAEVGMERMHVLRTLLLRQCFLGPRELQVDALVERALRSARHRASLALQPDMAVVDWRRLHPEDEPAVHVVAEHLAWLLVRVRVQRQAVVRQLASSVGPHDRPERALKPAIRRGTTTPFFT